jgi:XRE family aerobic/anaerobic benzoate catabolism transcriptional regulator
MDNDTHKAQAALAARDGTRNAAAAGADEGGQDASERDFLAELGRRVRHMRALRGMSRKTLAQVSGISERYLAQLEGGAGNLSIMLLRRVANATGAPIEDLVSDAPPPPDWPLIRELLRRASPSTVDKVRQLLAARSGAEEPSLRPPSVMVSRIALIGLRGAGKTTLGRIAAERLGWSFVELHKEIAAETGLSLAEIFNLYGQEGYRRLEQKALEATARRPGPMIVATSGGIVADPVTFDRLLTSFFTVWVRATPEEHMNRVREQGDLRPMADDSAAVEELMAILASREPLYGRARVVIDTSGKTVADTATELVNIIENYCERRCPWVTHTAAV